MSQTRAGWIQQAEAEMLAAKKRTTKLQREAAELREENTVLRRRLTGALYQVYGDWDRVNRELPCA